MKQQEQRVDFEQMVDEGWRAAIRLMNSQAADKRLIWQVVNAADCLAHPELFVEFPAIPAKKSQFIQKVVRLYEDDPCAPERALP